MTSFNVQLQTLNTEKTFNEEKLRSDIETGKKMIDELSEELSVMAL